MDFLLNRSPFGMFVVIKPSRIVIFILVWNILCGLGILLNGGSGSLKNPASALAMAAAAAYASFCGFAPIFSTRIRTRWCKEGSDFEMARFGLLLLGVVGLLCSFSLVSLFRMLTTSS